MNIEKTISEQAVSDILTPMLESQDRIVTEDVAPLFDQATGLDTPPASGTVTTTIEESRNLITAIIRKAWTATLTMLGGASVLSYIAAAYIYLRTRLQGNETYGIPDRRSEISASSPLAANLALLNDRKIGGVPEAEDGISLARLLGDGSYITQLIDNSLPWDLLTSAKKSAIFTCFPSLSKVKLNCKRLGGYSYAPNMWFPDTVEELQMDELERFEGDAYLSFPSANQNYKVWSFPKLKYSRCSFGTSNNKDTTMTNSWTEEILLPSMVEFGGYASETNMCNFTALKKVVLGTITKDITNNYHQAFYNDPNLIHLEFGADGGKVAINLWLNMWNPTNALDASRTDLIEEGSTAQNNLQQFLSNFRDYIAKRLTDNGSGKTLTLSQAVRNAIHAAEATYGIENIIITQKGWTISPAPN